MPWQLRHSQLGWWSDLGMAPVQGVAHSQDHVAGCHGPGTALAGGGLPVMAAVQQEDLGYVPLRNLLSNTLHGSSR